jgi:hypothetical protein
MTSRWRNMTLKQVYPHWIVGEVPDVDIPLIACNDMLAGNMDEEVIALAALSQRNLVQVGYLLQRAFARLGLPTAREREVVKVLARDKARNVARQIVLGEVSPLSGANAIFSYASDVDAFGSEDEADSWLAAYGSEFIQLSDAIEGVKLPDTVRRRKFEELIIKAAEALLADQPVPDWYMDRNRNLRRGQPPQEGEESPSDGDTQT